MEQDGKRVQVESRGVQVEFGFLGPSGSGRSQEAYGLHPRTLLFSQMARSGGGQLPSPEPSLKVLWII